MTLRQKPLVRFFDHYGLDSLRNMRLKVSDPTNLNDPLEFTPQFIKNLKCSRLKRYFRSTAYLDYLYSRHKDGPILNEQSREEFFRRARSTDSIFYNKLHSELSEELPDWFAEYKDQVATRYRVLCFVDPYRASSSGDLLMWAHYSDGHKGFRVWFLPKYIKTISLCLEEMWYRRTRAKMHLSVVAQHPEWKAEKKFEKALRDAMRIKNICWRYEREWRWIISVNECHFDKNANYSYVNFQPDAISRVDLGLNAPEVLREDVRNILGQPKFSHVALMQATLHSRKFQLQYEPVA